MLPWHQYLLGFLLVFSGVMHFQKTAIYQKIVPPYIPNSKSTVLISGIIEMLLGFLLLNKESQIFAAIAIIIMLILFLPAHIYMLQNKKASLKFPKWLLILRIPIQFALMYWAYLYV